MFTQYCISQANMFSVSSINIPRAKRALGDLNHCTSPLHKVLCLHKVALTIMQSPSRTGVCVCVAPKAVHCIKG